MDKDNLPLSESEWKIMEYIWDHAPVSGRQVIEQMQKETGWKRTTTLTLLHRMEEKGAVRSCSEQGIKQYEAVLQKDNAVIAESRNFLKRVYSGSLSLMVSSLTQKHALSQDEINQLYSILKEAKDDSLS